MYKHTPPYKIDPESLDEFFDDDLIGLEVDKDGLGVHVTERGIQLLKKEGYTCETNGAILLAQIKSTRSKIFLRLAVLFVAVLVGVLIP